MIEPYVKECKNPKILTLTKSYRERSYALGGISAIQRDGKRFCAWCGEVEFSNKQRKWCSNECSSAAMAWAYPQQEENLGQLLIRQDYRCNACLFDWGAVVESLVSRPKPPYGLADVDTTKFRTQYTYWIVKQLKRHMAAQDPTHRLEVDHITAIARGGLALDPANHQAICYECHKAKSKIDNSGPRKKKKRTASQIREQNDQLLEILSENMELLDFMEDAPD